MTKLNTPRKVMVALLILSFFLLAVYPSISSPPAIPFVVQFSSPNVDSNWIIDPKIKQMAKSLEGGWIPITIRFKDYLNASMVEELENLTYLKIKRNANGEPFLVNLGDIHILSCEIQGYEKLEELTKNYRDKILYVENNFKQQLSPNIVNETQNIIQTMSILDKNGEPQAEDIGQQQIIRWWVELTHAPEVWNLKINDRNITGQGVSIAFLDAGIDDKEFEIPGGHFYKEGVGEVILNIEGTTGIIYDTINTTYDPVPDIHPYGVNHGTACAGTAAGGEGRGVAKGANIIDIRVIDWDFGYDPTTLMYWMAWCVANRDKYNITVINFSDGTDNPIRMSQTLTEMINYIQLYCGIVVCLAVGNNANRIKSVSNPGNAEFAITSGAANKYGLPSTITSFGPTWDGHPKPEVLSPSTSGHTSLAGPTTAGICAMLAQTCKELNIPRDEWSLRIRAAIIRSASMNDILLPGWDPASGYGLLNAFDAFHQINDTSSWSKHVVFAKWPYTFAYPDGVYLIPLGSTLLPIYYWNVRVTVECVGQDMSPHLVWLQDFKPINSLTVIGDLQGVWIMSLGQKNSITYQVLALTPLVFFPPASVVWL
ncbi:MAG: S8 family serine peptidase [Candidatus Freyarchaeota archaeon]|nr:S8 family serine peptidase [Candidatus Jordarchaeia archaeon]MBS7281287.1 S8 family serine peptidase [Candidatus Jordarchaeia archaeon]